MPRRHDMTTPSRVMAAAGATLLVGAVLLGVWGIGRFAWINGTLAAMLAVRFHVVPIVIIALVVYLGWAVAHGRFDGIRGQERHVGNNPLVCNLDDRRVAGLCSGIARYADIDVVAVRVTALGLLVLVPVLAFIAYLVGAFVFRPL